MSPLRPLDDDSAYRALQTHDARFDGRFFVGVTSTGIYCRPVCRVRLPRRENCRFFGHAAAAEQAGFRPCLRCRPEQAPGLSGADAARSLAEAGARLITHAVAAGEQPSLPAIAQRLGITERHLRRIFQAHLGVSPIDWQTTQRLLLAKRLLTDTTLPITQVAAASGFGSLRRFNAAFAERYRLTPGALRRATGTDPGVRPLRLPWRPPYDRASMMAFLAARPLARVEAADDAGWWRRTLAVTHHGQTLHGWIALRLDEDAAALEVAPTLAPALGTVIERVRHLLDLDADPARIDPALASLPVAVRPGLRVPGCIDGFETMVRIVLGQQVSVAAACTLAARLVERFGAPLATPWPGLDRLFPSPRALAEASPEAIGTLGIVRVRVGALQALARAVDSGTLALHPAAPVEDTLARLRQLPGVGDWTAELAALRVLAWPDAFPATDAGVVKALGGLKAAQSLPLAEAWRPWRSYAVMQLWQSLVDRPEETDR
ncbi:helix-turn-helix domain-containing protein [Ideonella sp. 4Y11]|uniref:DNA-3-methyladenine glycosylase II n=1 Tax=Ideonella aquatica TaxID=2824119 RepID=A0A940YKW9_9BURK|nr:Ada metal-binding domain-containing protein [Ideonella aquatica]MBQ0961449.1 helix-turn-helix domain-containing protein [Ideonella aquatica]